MFKNYLKIAWRNLIKNKIYSMINISGLTVGMTCFILIALYIQFELSFDLHHDKAEQIYRITQQQKGNDYRGNDLFALAPLPLSEALKTDYPEIEAVTNLNVNFTLLIKDDESFPEQGLLTDKHIFDIFTIPILEGSAKEALEDPNAILLTETLSKKIFGQTSPLGKSILFGKDKPLTVMGVIADPPKNQHLNYSYLASIKLSGVYNLDVGNWVSNNYRTYLTLAKGHDYKVLQDKMVGYEKLAKTAYEAEGFNFVPIFFLQPLKDIHLYSNMNSEIGPTGDINQVYLFALIALIILLLASINYMNLATAKSAQRTKEVGVSKVLGASKRQLVMQFLGESFLLTIFSFIMALTIVLLLLPEFNDLLGKEIPFNLLDNGWILIGMVLIALLIGVLSGLYPAIYLSSVSPVKALRGNFLKSYKDGAILRNSLVIGQFAAAIVLAISSVVIHQQLSYIQGKKLGYSKESVVHVAYFEKEISEKEAVIRAELLNHPKINKVSMSSQLPMNITSQGIVREWEGNYEKDELWIYRSHVDYDYMDLFEMEIIEGRGFSKEFSTDTVSAYILNESALKKMGWKTAVGKKFHNGQVIGVVKDYHLQTFDLAIEPLYMRMRYIPELRNFGQVILKVDLEDFENTRAYIEETMKAVVPLANYNVRFMEDSYAQLYDEETRLGKVFNIFSFLALFIAAMGLFGLVSFQVLQRTKEIGIRKVLGSPVSGIVSLLVKDFLKLVVFALLLAAPIAYYTMDIWLQEFTYRIELAWWVFILVGFAAIVLAFITISFQSFIAANANPVKSLRTE